MTLSKRIQPSMAGPLSHAAQAALRCCPSGPCAGAGIMLCSTSGCNPSSSMVSLHAMPLQSRANRKKASTSGCQACSHICWSRGKMAPESTDAFGTSGGSCPSRLLCTHPLPRTLLALRSPSPCTHSCREPAHLSCIPALGLGLTAAVGGRCLNGPVRTVVRCNHRPQARGRQAHSCLVCLQSTSCVYV